MSIKSTIEVEGVGSIDSAQGFTTNAKYVEKAAHEGTRVTLTTPAGRISILPSQVLAIKEIKKESEESTNGNEPGPFNK